MIVKNGGMVATVWAESIPYWATASNVVVLSLERDDQVWLLLLNRASYLHGYMYTTFSGFLIFENWLWPPLRADLDRERGDVSKMKRLQLRRRRHASFIARVIHVQLVVHVRLSYVRLRVLCRNSTPTSADHRRRLIIKVHWSTASSASWHQSSPSVAVLLAVYKSWSGLY